MADDCWSKSRSSDALWNNSPCSFLPAASAAYVGIRPPKWSRFLCWGSPEVRKHEAEDGVGLRPVEICSVWFSEWPSPTSTSSTFAFPELCELPGDIADMTLRFIRLTGLPSGVRYITKPRREATERMRLAPRVGVMTLHMATPSVEHGQ